MFTIQSEKLGRGKTSIIGTRRKLSAALGEAVEHALEHETTAYVFAPDGTTYVAETAGRFVIAFRRHSKREATP